MAAALAVTILASAFLCYQASHVCDTGLLSCGDLQCFNSSQKCNGKKDCSNGRDEANCTGGAGNTVTRHVLVDGHRKSENNYAWLVTPFIFGLCCVYATYKCLKEGFCTLHRLRQRSTGSDSAEGGRHYFVLDRWSFHSVSSLPTSRLGTTASIRGSTHRQLILVTNHSFSVSLSDMQQHAEQETLDGAVVDSMAPPSYDEVVTTQRLPPPAPPSLPPTPGLHNDGFISLPHEDSDLPSYSEAAGLLHHVDSCSSTTPLHTAAEDAGNAHVQSESQL